MASIKKNIYLAISLKKAEKTPPCLPMKRLSQTENPFRTSLSHKERESTRSITSSEQGIRDLLESPSRQPEKRFRLMSELSQTSSEDVESVGDTNGQIINEHSNVEKSPDDNIETTIRRQSVDILSEPVETKMRSISGESDYNRVNFKPPVISSHQASPIISTITIAKPGYQTSLLLDERGYSHVNLASVRVQKDASKQRSLSDNSNMSSASCRSTSVGSRDSGILYQTAEKTTKQSEDRQLGHPSTSSFDSAVSTSSVVENAESIVLDTKPTRLSVEIHEVTIPMDCKNHELETTGDSCIYQDVSFGESKSEITTTLRPKLKKSNSTGYFKTEENPYEELDKYRKGKKDLVKHLGMDPKVDPSSVPPSLPDRPMSHKMKRKFGTNGDKKIFTLPFAKGKSKKNREKALSSTSSESDSETGSGSRKRDELSSIKVWPLGNTSVADSNDLYQPVAIERFLNDQEAVNDKVIRERSCSLNLNKTPDLKRPSVSSANVELRGPRARHGRNASLNVDLLTNDPNIEPFFPQKDSKLGSSTSPVSQVSSTFCPTDSYDNDTEISIENDGAFRCDSHESEPIYAEVMPVASRGGEFEEPFPDLDEWKPQNMSDFQTNELDVTNYEDERRSSVDLFNMGFVSNTETNEQNEPKTGVLIELDTEVSDIADKQRTLSAFDIFNATNTSIINHSVKDTDVNAGAQPTAADMNQAFLDIFSLGATTTQTQSSADLLSLGNHTSFKQENSVAYDMSVTGNTHWADFSQFEASQKEVTNVVSDSIYMDMSTCKNESIYVMPSEAKQN